MDIYESCVSDDIPFCTLLIVKLLFEASHLLFHQCINLRPTIDNIKVVMKNNRQNVAGSLKNRMPTMTVPTAPIPVHTGYAVPMGMV